MNDHLSSVFAFSTQIRYWKQEFDKMSKNKIEWLDEHISYMIMYKTATQNFTLDLMNEM